MKFSLFVHMERSDLAKPHSELVSELEELVLMAERAGFETAWIGEHHGMEFTISPNPFINIAYLAARTSRIRLGTGTIIAPFWHPIKLAGDAAMADVISGGRLLWVRVGALTRGRAGRRPSPRACPGPATAPSSAAANVALDQLDIPLPINRLAWERT